MASTTDLPSIVIVGGGPSGLCLGLLLHRQNIPFTIYELRDRPSDASLAALSGMLDLHEESGLAALKACGLLDQFQQRTVECSEADLVIDHHGRVLHSDDGTLEPRPEIARNALTKLFLASLPEESIRFGHKLLKAERASGGKISLDFGPHGVFEHDYVVGSDGAWSKVRTLVTDVKPHNGGIQFLGLDILAATERYPHLSTLVGSGSCMILGENKGIFAQRGVGGSIRLYVGIRSPEEDSFHGADTTTNSDELREKLTSDPELFGNWGPALKDLLSTGVRDTAAATGRVEGARPLYMLPIGHRWEAQPGVALIGDAAHLMMPWAGEGVNLALWDSLDLAAAITEGWVAHSRDGPTFQTAMVSLTAAFDGKMFERSRRAAEETWTNSKTIFSDNAAESMATFLRQAHEG